MSQTIGVTTPYTISQDTTIVSNDLPVFVHDYLIPVTFSSAVELATADGSLNGLFSTRTYQQNGADPTTYDINLVIDQVKLKTLLSAPDWYGALTTGDEGCPTTGAAPAGVAGNTLLGNRLLEIMALKVFENAGARAAILNDSAFTLESVMDGVITGIAASVVTDKADIFGQYASLGRLAGDDVSAPVDFDFTDLKMSFPLYLDGTLGGSVSALVANKTGLGSDIVEGVYHIPISLMLDGSTVV